MVMDINFKETLNNIPRTENMQHTGNKTPNTRMNTNPTVQTM